MLSVYNVNECVLATPSRVKSRLDQPQLIVTGTFEDPFYVPSDTPKDRTPILTPDPNNSSCNSSPNRSATTIRHNYPFTTTNSTTNTSIGGGGREPPKSDYYRHKYLLKLRRKQYENNFDLGLFFLIRFGGPKSPMGRSILNDAELLECSRASSFSHVNQLHSWFDAEYKRMLSSLKLDRLENLDRANLAQVNRKLSRNLGRKKWFTRDRLEAKVREQERWNPFSIFGSSLPYISVREVFNLANSSTITPSTTNNGSTITGSNRAAVSATTTSSSTATSSSGFNDPKTAISTTTTTTNPNGFTGSENIERIDWNQDPLVVSEVLWYLNATNRCLDKSRSVCALQKCFCTTPDPSIRFNWNDPRCKFWREYRGPRPSMGQILSESTFQAEMDEYRRVKEKWETFGNMSKDEELILQHYFQYFNNNYYYS